MEQLPLTPDMPEQNDTLNSIDRYVAELHAVIYPHVITRTTTHQVLTQLREQLGGYRVSGEDVKRAVNTLTRRGVLIEQTTGQRRAQAEHVTTLCISAHAGGRMDAMLESFEAQEYRYNGYRIQGARLRMLARGHVVAGRIDALQRLGGDDEIDWTFLAEPGGSQLLSTLTNEYLQRALPMCLAYVALNVRNPQPLLAYLQTVDDSVLPAAAGRLAFVHVLQGQFDAALAVFKRCPDSLRVRGDRAATQALLAMLRGDDTAALEAIQSALDAAKAGSRKRNVFPDSEAFALSLIALVRLDTPAATGLLKRLLQTADKELLQQRLVPLVQAALDTRDGVGGFSVQPKYLFELLMEGWLACWSDNFGVYELAGRPAALAHLHEQAQAAGFRWVAAELVAVMARAADKTRHLDRIDVTTRIAAGQGAHAALGCTPVVNAVTPLQEWEYPLKALEQVAFESKRKVPAKTGSKPAARKRLVWEISRFGSDNFEFAAREQSAARSGGWSKGRTVALSRLHRDAPSMDFLIEQDREAAARLKQRRYWGGPREHVLEADGVFALVGHPNVINAAGESVEILARDPELVIHPLDADTLEVFIEPYRLDGSNYQVCVASERRVEVTRFTARHKRLFDVVPVGGLRLPVAARDRLVDAVSELAGDIQVRSGIEGVASSAAEVVTADPEPWVRLVPAGDGLAVSVVVDPVPGAGNFLAPGLGGGTVIVHRNGGVAQTTRDLALERARAAELAVRHPLLAVASSGDAIVLEQPHDCLELIDALQRDNVRCLWPESEPFKVVGRADASRLSLTVKSADQWFSATGTLQVDESLSLQLGRLFELLDAAPGERFVEVQDGQFVALSEVFRRQLEDLRSLSSSAAGGSLRIHPLAALALEDLTDAADLDVDRAWEEQRERLAEADSYEPALPTTLDTELRPYQLDGFRWLARLAHWGAGACLADDMGLGKTVQALALFLQRAAGGPALVVAPTSVASNWVTEAQRFAPTLNVIPYGGTPAARRELLAAVGNFDLVVATYGLLQNDIDSFAEVRWHSALLDEAQAIKNAATQRARAVRKLQADFRFVTTGTPVQNDLSDLHALFGFLNPGLLGGDAQFRRNFLIPIERDNNPEARERLRRLIAPFVLRRLKNQVLKDLPARTEVTLHVELSADEAALYEALRKRALDDLQASPRPDAGAGETHLRVLAHLTRLRLACCNPSLVMDSGAPDSSKLAMFAETLTELLQNRHKVLVFSQFVTHLRLIEAYLISAGVNYQYLDGQTPAKTRKERVDAFQSGDGDVFLISLKAGGAGLNLTAADYVIHMDPWWNPAVEDQASDRAHRIGQTRPVTIYRLVTRGTIEEQIVELHHRKRELADSLLEGADSAARLELADLLTLLRDPT